MSVSKWLVLVAAVAGAMAQDPLAPDAGKPPTITTTVNASTSDDRVGDGVLAHKQAGNVSIGTQVYNLFGEGAVHALSPFCLRVLRCHSCTTDVCPACCPTTDMGAVAA